MNNKLLTITVLVLAGTGFTLYAIDDSIQIKIQDLSVQINRRKRPFEYLTASVPIGQVAPHFDLPSLNGERFSSKDLNAKLNLLIFFDLMDCGSCLAEAALWKELDNKYDETDLQIFGISKDQGNNQSLIRFKSSRELKFPILLDEKNNMKRAYKISHSPIKILIDRNGIILDASMSNSNLGLQRAYKKKIDIFFHTKNKKTHAQ